MQLSPLSLISFIYCCLFADTRRHSDVLQMKAVIAARPTTVAVILANSHFRTVREEPCRPLRLLLAGNDTVGLQTYLAQVRGKASFVAWKMEGTIPLTLREELGPIFGTGAWRIRLDLRGGRQQEARENVIRRFTIVVLHQTLLRWL